MADPTSACWINDIEDGPRSISPARTYSHTVAGRGFEPMSKRFSLGIDLGTTNSAMALTDMESDRTEVLEITQVVRPNPRAPR